MAALLRTLSPIDGVKADNDDEKIGVDIVKRTIEKAPIPGGHGGMGEMTTKPNF